ncbi:DUF192 domain-containing protein [Phreatobacter sp.]|uniref:DUF192 domain-containing protein n=1 Tax=Phreatobacter sp. TaxID=1966341 RepID=UPI003F6E6475
MLIDRRLVLAAGFASLAGGTALARTPLTQLTIVTRAGARHPFQLELADTPEKRSRGLMFRRSLPDGQGMLFEFGARETEVTMWMKNTYIPLDMIFIRANGVIRNIAENTTPLSEAIVASDGPVKGVLEVIAGTSRRLGIAPGDRVEHPWFGG